MGGRTVQFKTVRVFNFGGIFTCFNLKSITIPDSVTRIIGDLVFQVCNKLTIYGGQNSCAESYAKSHNIPFVVNGHKHTYGNWKEVKSATCTEEGVQQHICSSCGNVETKPINAFGHNLENVKVTKEATISETGTKAGTCKNCKQIITDTIPCSSVDDATGAIFETDIGVLEKGAKIEIKEIKLNSETYKLIQNSLKDISTKFVAYDIMTILNNAEIQPKGMIKITLKIPDDFSQNVAIYYVSDDGENEKLESTINLDGTISANLNHFSIYVICDLDIIENTTADKKSSDKELTTKNNSIVYIIIAVLLLVVITTAVVTILLIRKRNRKIIKKE